MGAGSLPCLLAALALTSVACVGDDTSVGPPPIDAGAKPDANSAHDADDASTDATDASAPTGLLPFDAAGYDAAGFDSGQALGCAATGGAVMTLSCCIQEGAFPDTCLVGACTCAPGFSTPTTVCRCPPGTCWGRQVGQCVAWDGGPSPP